MNEGKIDPVSMSEQDQQMMQISSKNEGEKNSFVSEISDEPGDIIEETHYEGLWPDEPEFQKPWEHGVIQIGQGNSNISENGASLQSEGFSLCSAAITRDKDSLLTSFAHLEGGEFNYKQLTGLEELVGENLYTLLVKGSESIVTTPAKKQIEDRGIFVEREITIDTGSKHWDVAYRPKENIILVNNRSKNVLIKLRGFANLSTTST